LKQANELSALRRAARPPLSARSSPDIPARTRDRLLHSAEVLFARHGFRGTSIRRLTTAAGCNLAGVNYHFGGKVGLYRDMFRRRLEGVREQRLGEVRRLLGAAHPSAGLEDLLRAFTTAFLETHRDESGGHRLMLLFSREQLDPHLPSGMLRRELIKPMHQGLLEAIRTIGYDIGGIEGRRCVQSLIAQLVNVVRMRAAPHLSGTAERGEDPLPAVVDHIVRFSAAGIRACARTGAPPRTTHRISSRSSR
jgi:AcrR family transcriptional regulator